MTLSNSSETIIFGGSFNPPTVSHMTMAEASLALPETQEVWFMPSADRLDKKIGVSADHRINMLSRMIGQMTSPRLFKICTIDLELPPPTQTYKTVDHLKTEFPDRSFRFLFGSDSYATIHKWEDGDYIKNELPLLIVPRGGLSQSYGENVKLLGCVPFETSSTAVREQIKHKQAIGGLVCRNVAEYIDQHQLYV